MPRWEEFDAEGPEDFGDYLPDYDPEFEDYRQERMYEIESSDALTDYGGEREEVLAEYLYLFYADDPRFADWDVEDWQDALDRYSED